MTNYTLLKSGLGFKPTRLVAIFLILVCGLAANPVLYGSPFKKAESTATPAAEMSLQNRVVGRINQTQLAFRKEITGLVRQVKKNDNATAVFTLLVFSFLYGLIHALGPGHGKTIIMSLMLMENRPSLLRSIVLGAVVAFGEAVSAVAIVYSIYYFSLGRLGPAFSMSESRIKLIAYVFILVVGLLLLVFRIRKQLVKSGDRSEKEVHTRLNSMKGVSIAIFLGMIPCPGVMILLVFMLSLKLPLMGLLLALSMAVGMTLTISGFGAAVALSKSRTLKLVSANRTRTHRLEAGLEIGGALLIVIIALFFLTSL